MRAEVIPEGGLGRRPVVMSAQQIVVYGDLGTPIAIVSDDGFGNIEFAHAGMPDFNEILRRHGVNGPLVNVESIRAPRPAGRRIVV